MLKIFAAMLLATSIYAGTASARGGGGAEPMPSINFTDMPNYPAKRVNQTDLPRKNVRWHRGFVRDH